MRPILFTLAITLTLACEARAQCCGDCDGSGTVAVNELIIGVNNALGGFTRRPCCSDCNADGQVAVNELVTAVANALSRCGEPHATPTATSESGCPFRFDTNTQGASCEFRGHFIGRDFARCPGDFPIFMSGDGRFVRFEIQSSPRVTITAETRQNGVFADPVGYTIGFDPLFHPWQSGLFELCGANGCRAEPIIPAIAIRLEILPIPFDVEGCCPVPSEQCTTTGNWRFFFAEEFVRVHGEVIPTRTPTPTLTRTPTRTFISTPAVLPTPRPTPGAEMCPVDFSTRTPYACLYRGRISTRCLEQRWMASWTSDGNQLIVVVTRGSETVYFVGDDIVATYARLRGWARDPSLSDLQPLTGDISMNFFPEALWITPTSSPFTSEGCAFTGYAGTFVDVLP